MSHFPGHTNLIVIVTNASMGADVTSTSQNLNASSRYCIQYTWSAGTSPVGEMILQGSNDGVNYFNISSQSVSGNSGTGGFNVEGASYSYVQIFYDRTSGTATLNANINVRYV